MPEGEIIKAPGTLTKEENLINIERSIMPNTMVLESSHPFPGYRWSNLPEDPAPGSIYLVTKTGYDGEDIMRAAKTIKKDCSFKFDASFGDALMFGKTYHFIRVRYLECFDCIGKLQQQFEALGIRFMKKKAVSAGAFIRLRKFFSLQKTDEHIYKDLDRCEMHYFEIPYKPDWEFFKKITFYIRNNIDNYSYDAALAAIYLEEITDMVRIYTKDITPDQLRFIRKKYLYELSHPDHLE